MPADRDSGIPASDGLHKALIATVLMALLVSALVLYFWHFLNQQRQQHLQGEFEADVSEIKTSIAERMTAYGQILKGGRSLFYASSVVSREEWHTYVSSLELEKDYPGIQGVGYAVTIPASKLSAHEAEIRTQGFSDYRVWPKGKRDPYSAIIYLEPFDWRNKRAFGYDMFSEPTRHEAMVRARDSGLPALTGKVLLVQETNKAPQAGTLLYVPLYRKGWKLQTVTERQQALIGWVYSPYRMDNLIEGMLGHLSKDIRLRVYDSDRNDPGNLLYDSFANERSSANTDENSMLIHQTLSLDTAGRHWVLHFDALPSYARTIGMGSLYKEEAGLLLIGLLLILLTWTLFNTRRKAESLANTLTASLRESEERWSFALEGSGDGVWDWDLDSNEAFFSPRFCQMLGLPDNTQFDLDEWRKHIHPDDIERVDQALLRHLNGETAEYIIEKRVQHVDGHYIWVLARGKVISRDQNGRALRLVGTYSDITARKQAEERIHLLSRAMQQSGEAVIITNAKGLIEYVNPAFRAITGYTENEVIGQMPSLLNSGMQEKQLYEEMWSTISHGGTWHGRIVDRKKDGSFYPAMLTISPIINNSGTTTHFIGIQQDLQEYEDLEAQFHQSQKMEAVGTLVGGIAHDFNNTLAGITGNLFLAKQEIKGLPRATERLETVEKLSFRAAGMIKQLLTFSRKSRPEMAPLSVTSFLKETIKLHRVSLPENIELRTDVASEDLRIQGDINLLQQVMINLINNARDAVRHSQNPRIEIALEPYTADKEFKARHLQLTSEQFALITVCDNGHGIKSEDMPHLFEPFFTTKAVGKGTGLGLSMVYGAIESHNGFLTVDSEEGQGACFRIYLPLLPSAEEALKEEVKSRVEKGGDETVLLVDDHEEALSTHRDVLESLGYRVLTATDGVEAVERYREQQHTIDVVILDVVMPRMGGKEAFEAIRMINPEAKIMFATGYDSSNVSSNEALQDIPVISKPFSVGELSQSLQALLKS